MSNSDTVRSTFDQDQLSAIEEIAKDLRMAGKSDEDAEKLAQEEVKKLDQVGEKAWNDFIRKVQLGDIIDDLIRRQLIWFRKETKKKGKEIDFRLEIHKQKIPNTIYYKGATLSFDMLIDGQWIRIAERGIEFDNDKEARDVKTWKFQLYDSMFQMFMNNAIGNIIITYLHGKQQSTPE